MNDLYLSTQLLSLMSNRTNFNGLYGWKRLKFGPVCIGLGTVVLLCGTWSRVSPKFELKTRNYNLGASLKKGLHGKLNPYSGYLEKSK